jgi:shikimate dehydrogenase
VAHSLSPRLHNEAFRLIGLEWRYFAIQVLEDELALLPDLFALQEFRGANVTVPHKQAVMTFLQRIDPLAAAIGAVNSIVSVDGNMVGFNTDMDGFLDPLLAFESKLKGADAMVFGTGGAQKAVSYALRRLGFAQVRVVSRSPDPSDKNQIPYSDVARYVDTTTLFVNATPLGLPHTAERSPLDGLDIHIRSHQIGYDLLYKPRITPFLNRFLKEHAPVIGGMAMFIGQAKRSFHLWTGLRMPEEAIRVVD